MKLLCVCGKTFEVDDRRVGQTSQCPHCGRQVRVPRFDDEPADAPTPQAREDEDPGFADQLREAMKRKLLVTCGSCGRGLKISMRLAGRGARCPACKGRIRIPELSKSDEAKLARFLAAGYTFEQEEPAEIEVIDELASAVKAVGRHPRTFRKRSWALPIVLAAVAALGIGLLIGYLMVPSDELDAWLLPSDAASSAVDDGADEPFIVPGVSPAPSQPSSRGADEGPASDEVPPEIRILSVETDAFAQGGYFPARAGRIYWRVQAIVTAGSSALKFATLGEDVLLKVGAHQVRSLGSQKGVGLLPSPGRQRRVSLRPGEAETVAMMFEVPASATVATLLIGEARGVRVGPIQPAPAPKKSALAGVYDEVLPRNLKPLLRNPVMAAVQAAANQRLNIWPNKAEFSLNVHNTGVSGSAKPIGEGLYEAYLRYGRDTLNCKLRLMADGYLILYLADGPFHQLTYLRRGGKPRPMPGALFVQ